MREERRLDVAAREPIPEDATCSSGGRDIASGGARGAAALRCPVPLRTAVWKREGWYSRRRCVGH